MRKKKQAAHQNSWLRHWTRPKLRMGTHGKIERDAEDGELGGGVGRTLCLLEALHFFRACRCDFSPGRFEFESSLPLPGQLQSPWASKFTQERRNQDDDEERRRRRRRTTEEEGEALTRGKSISHRNVLVHECAPRFPSFHFLIFFLHFYIFFKSPGVLIYAFQR